MVCLPTTLTPRPPGPSRALPLAGATLWPLPQAPEPVIQGCTRVPTPSPLGSCSQPFHYFPNSEPSTPTPAPGTDFFVNFPSSSLRNRFLSEWSLALT